MLLLGCPFNPIAYARTSHSHGHTTRTKRTKAARSERVKSTNGSVHVQGYTRKDGTVVRGYDRSEPNTARTSHRVTVSTSGREGAITSSSVAPHLHPYKIGHLASGYSLDQSVRTGMFGRIKRSGAAKDAFKRENPCPTNGNTSGSCRGYVIDHVKPLECGGADNPSNMQWQTVADGKLKDKTERYCR